METYDEDGRELENNYQNLLQAKIAELEETIEKLNSKVALILELKSELEAANVSIRSKMEAEIKAKKVINEISEVLYERRKELQMMKRARENERRERLKMKQRVRMSRHTLKTLQVSLEAAKTESEAFSASLAEAIGYINNSGTSNSNVELAAEEYFALTEKAKEETTLAEWRVSLFLKQKLAAEASRNLALSRLKELKRNKTKENEDGNIIAEIEEQIPVSDDTRTRVNDKSNLSLLNKKRRSRTGKKASKKKKPHILIQASRFLVRTITRFFR